MNRKPNLILAGLFVLMIAVGGLVGAHFSALRESEMFYRWIFSEATRFRLADMAVSEKEEEATGKKDRQLFVQILDKTERDLANEPAKEDSKGEPVKKLLSVTADDSKSALVWQLASGPKLEKERAKFLIYLHGKKLTNVGSQFDPHSVYSGEGAGVSLSNIFFGFRQIAANFVWLQVDRYWHQGMMQRMVPLMKTCVMLDPSFVEAYLLGAWHLAYNATAKMPDTPEPLKKWSEKYQARIGEKELYYYLAIDFLKDGIQKNPFNYKLYFDLGYGIFNLKMKDYTDAVHYLSQAIQQRHDDWVPRMLYISYEENGQYKEALAGWQDYLKRNYDNQIRREKAQRFIPRNEALLKEQLADLAAERAEKAKKPADAEAARAEAAKLRDEAKQIWEKLAGPGGDESFATGRLMRMKAIKLIEEQRYLEAIAILENARWKCNEIFDEASTMIIDAKLKAGVPLSTSEKKAVIRKEEEKKFKEQKPAA